MESLTRRVWWVMGAIVLLLGAAVVAMIADARRSADGVAASDFGTAVVWPTALAQAQDKILPPPMLGASSPAARAIQSSDWRRELVVCGGSPVTLNDTDSEEARSRHLSAALRAVSPPPWQAMQRSTDERIRAAGHALVGQVESIVPMATATRDAKIYAMAQQACRAVPATASQGDSSKNAWCNQLSATQRGVLEPDNAVAWIQAALEAQDRGDAAATNDALMRAARARTNDPHAMALVHEVDRHLSITSEAGALPSPWLLQAAMVEGAVNPAGSLARLCAKSDPQHGTRRDACAALASLLIDKPATHEDLTVASLVEEQLGRERDATEKRTRAAKAVFEGVAQMVRPMAGPYSCGELALLKQYAQSAAAGQGWAWMRDKALAHAGSQDVLLKRYDDALAQRKLQSLAEPTKP